MTRHPGERGVPPSACSGSEPGDPAAVASAGELRRQPGAAPRLALPLLLSVLAQPLMAQVDSGPARHEATYPVAEASILEMQAAMEAGRTTSRAIVAGYLDRIARYDEVLHAALAVHPGALEEAEQRDRERAEGRVRGPLHGIPIALKDNIQTLDLPTTGGTLALRGFVAPYEATIARNLRAAGAIVIAKTGLTELANWMSLRMPGNYNALRGFAMNPYDPRPDPRAEFADGQPAMPTAGSSSGVGTAASLWAASVGTETSGSILSPSNQTMLVGIKPTTGRLSRHGIIPITADQDTPGPMARTVADAAILLGALEGEGADPADIATGICEPPPGGDYRPFLDPEGLRGARIGIPRAFYYDPITLPGSPTPRGGRSAAQAALMAEAIRILEASGAQVFDPVDIPSIVASGPEENFLRWPICEAPPSDSVNCSTVMMYGMKRDFNRWVASLGAAAPFPTLTGLREWNVANAGLGTLRFGQELLDLSDSVDLERDRERYERDLARDRRLSREQGIDAAMETYRLDALLFPAMTGSSIAARGGHPTVIVPFGTVPNEPTAPFPEGFGARPMPFGVSFTGSRCSEPRLIRLAYAFEQATRRRFPPPDFP